MREALPLRALEHNTAQEPKSQTTVTIGMQRLHNTRVFGTRHEGVFVRGVFAKAGAYEV